ncbi:hypothetical protein [Brevundimonas lenta]|uniref:DUF3887 domain-containing protein n=1 Tax=Brevundimonas lenta TaxID=424796 RepID=A0A7W6JC26_9CAUL|nr:hypothetical protein [Brevundimonas lenta]MBB4081433.1 hypothetical protein [Brevundimonas lenta]
MKPLLIAAALVLAPAAAHAQVAAGSMPNTFDQPAAPARASAAAPAPAARATAPANPRAEATLRAFISGAQTGAIDYSVMTPDLATKVREQEGQVRPLIQSLGAVQAVDFVDSQDGADLFAVVFANAATEWIIGFDESGKVAALLFRPAQ